MFATRLLCSWIGALALAAGAFCQSYVPISVDQGTQANSINEKGKIAGFTVTSQDTTTDLCATPAGRLRFSSHRAAR